MEFQWDPRDIQIRTRGLQLSLEPVVVAVRDLVSQQRDIKQKQRSRRSLKVIRAVERAVETFLRTGTSIARENPAHSPALLEAVREVEVAGLDLSRQAAQFSSSPLQLEVRAVMMEAARTLLSAVTKLVMLADHVDVMKIIQTVADTQRRLAQLPGSRPGLTGVREVERKVGDLLEMTGRRQEDLLDPAECEALARVRASLATSSARLRSRSDLAVSEVSRALERLQSVLQHHGHYQGEEEVVVLKEDDVEEVVVEEEEKLLVALDNLDEAVSELEFDRRAISDWREGLETILTSLHTRVRGQGEVSRQARLALNHLVQVRSAGLGGAALNTALENFLRSTRNIRNIITATEPSQEDLEDDLEEEKPLVSPLDLMISAAEAGDEAGVRLYSAMFSEHALKLVEVADLACRMSSSQESDGVEEVRQAASHLQSLHSQVRLVHLHVED